MRVKGERLFWVMFVNKAIVLFLKRKKKNFSIFLTFITGALLMTSLFYKIPIEIQREIIGLVVITPKNLVSLKLVSKKFKRLVEQVYDHNEPNGIHFWYNIFHENHQEVARLLQDKCILNAFNQYNYFSDICSFGDLSTVKSLIDDPRIDPNAGDDTPILRAYRYGKMDIFEFLLNHPKVDIQSNIVDIFKTACVMGLGLVESLFLNNKVSISPDLVYQGIVKSINHKFSNFFLHTMNHHLKIFVIFYIQVLMVVLMKRL